MMQRMIAMGSNAGGGNNVAVAGYNGDVVWNTTGRTTKTLTFTASESGDYLFVCNGIIDRGSGAGDATLKTQCLTDNSTANAVLTASNSGSGEIVPLTGDATNLFDANKTNTNRAKNSGIFKVHLSAGDTVTVSYAITYVNLFSNYTTCIMDVIKL